FVPTMSEQDHKRKDPPSPTTPSTSQAASPSADPLVMVRPRPAVPRPAQGQAPPVRRGHLHRPPECIPGQRLGSSL
ncbi:hypothetical protein BGZ95_008764, partial [Linnemannia exigua]